MAEEAPYHEGRACEELSALEEYSKWEQAEQAARLCAATEAAAHAQIATAQALSRAAAAIERVARALEQKEAV